MHKMGRKGAVMTRDAVDAEDLESGFHEEGDAPVEGRPPYTMASPVTVRRADGSFQIMEAYTPEEFERIVYGKR